MSSAAQSLFDSANGSQALLCVAADHDKIVAFDEATALVEAVQIALLKATEAPMPVHVATLASLALGAAQAIYDSCAGSMVHVENSGVDHA